MKEELHNLDILDASFPCSVFSIAGDREKAWGKEKVFRFTREEDLDALLQAFRETTSIPVGKP